MKKIIIILIIMKNEKKMVQEFENLLLHDLYCEK